MVKKRKTEKDESLKRVHRKTILFNKREIQAIEHYLKKYKIKNNSKFMREVIITSVLKKFDDDYPSLFEKKPTLFNQDLKRKI
ncbi:MAG: hypothetical protein PF485_00715 [Bacteroidales bacterium]|jgi:hypothetical protein|nr:hypothetical protein [Bacteroidales bacterium]